MFQGIINWFKSSKKEIIRLKCDRCKGWYNFENVSSPPLCSICLPLIQNLPLEFEYSSSDHWHTKDKLNLIICSYNNNKVYKIYYRIDKNSGWKLVGQEPNFVWAVLTANVASERCMNFAGGSYL